MEAELQAVLVPGAEALAQDARPHAPRGAKLRHFFEEVL
jgi:hypothetical protein